MSKWKPIETAPMHTPILLLTDDKSVRIGECYSPPIIDLYTGGFKSEIDFGDFSATAYYSKDYLPTHWMPLPDPPAQQATSNDTP